MKRCKHYDFDCKKEEMTCEGCAYNKPKTKTDRTYCINANCATKEICDRYIEHYEFDKNKLYCFMAECEEYQG